MALALGAAWSCRAEFVALVIGVHDGDTITVLADSRRERVRLFGIDAPERAQPHGVAAWQALASRVAGRRVRVVERGRDRFGRLLAVVHVERIDVNADMIRSGHAWVFGRADADPRLVALEARARTARRGLWRDPQALPPWQWRDVAPPRPLPRGTAEPAEGVS